MTTRMVRDVQQLLGPLDPAPRQSLLTDADREADWERILLDRRGGAAVPPHDRPVARRRLIVLGAGVAAAAVVGVAAINIFNASTPAYAATPAPLVYAGAAEQKPAAAELAKIIASARKVPAAVPAGAYQHLVTEDWSLWSQIDSKRVTSAVIAARHESWRAADGSGRTAVGYDAPVFVTPEGKHQWKDAGSPTGAATPELQDFTAGQFPQMWTSDPPADFGAFQQWLAQGHPAANQPAETIAAVTDLARERVLDPATRVNVLRALVSLPGLTADGPVVDRAGRTGAAFSLISDYSGLPTRYTVIVDPATGALHGYEATLTTMAGKLDVKVPAVIAYQSYLIADHVATIG